MALDKNFMKLAAIVVVGSVAKTAVVAAGKTATQILKDPSVNNIVVDPPRDPELTKKDNA